MFPNPERSGNTYIYHHHQVTECPAGVPVAVAALDLGTELDITDLYLIVPLSRQYV